MYRMHNPIVEAQILYLNALNTHITKHVVSVNNLVTNGDNVPRYAGNIVVGTRNGKATGTNSDNKGSISNTRHDGFTTVLSKKCEKNKRRRERSIWLWLMRKQDYRLHHHKTLEAKILFKINNEGDLL